MLGNKVTEKERRLIQLLRGREGLTFTSIGRRLGRAPKTVEAYYVRDLGHPKFAYSRGLPPPPPELTLILFKPDAVRQRLVGVLIQRFEGIGLDLIYSRRARITDPEMVYQHHPDLFSKHGAVIADAVVDYMMSGPLIATVWSGIDAVAAGRRQIGPTFPAEAPATTIRGQFSRMSRRDVLKTGVMEGNIIHGSRTTDEAQREIKLWFGSNACGR
ncbi:nucleoside-diphosphate kinase [Amycolatopsis azurea]|uniref:nucleoside-diphosphate kinase n=1 Tax=Amycolatopsis azurea TaxID=36819 RepID=UPI0037F373C9